MIIKPQFKLKEYENGLYLVSTPLGNLKDITLRAIEVLQQSHYILCEDTRVSKNLLDKYQIKSKLISNHKFNEKKNVVKIIEYLKSGKLISLISDAGTPGISDPGYLLVRNALENEIKVSCLPGPTALIPALVQSGIPCDRFIFEGFLPSKKGRLGRLKKMASESKTIVFYESPHKLLKLIYKMKPIFGGDRKIAIVREISKIYESTFAGTLEEAKLYFEEKTPKGEFVIIVEGINN